MGKQGQCQVIESYRLKPTAQKTIAFINILVK